MQTLPSSGPAREALREKGQFWTPQWLARVMAAWVTQNRPSVLFDPAVGPGTFFAAARDIGFEGDFAGFELDDAALAESFRLGLPSSQLRAIEIGDFIGSRVGCCYPAIVSNPPYIRHHRLTAARKTELRHMAQTSLGFTLDGRVGLHVYFLLKCLDLLAPGGRLAFLLPADICEGVCSSVLWRRLTERFCLDAVLTFAGEAAPFPSVDTNAMVFLMSRRPSARQVTWLRVTRTDTEAIRLALAGRPAAEAAVQSLSRSLDELLATGFSRPPRPHITASVPLSAFARVVRGVASGANEFFFLTSSQIRELGLKRSYFKRAIGRTRDCPNGTLEPDHLECLDSRGRPTWLLSLGIETKDVLPTALQDYLQVGERMGLPELALIMTRNPWYRMERRTAPALLFAYLGRRDCRFILNLAGAIPLTGFLCVYPWDDSTSHTRKLWRALNHPDTIANLVYVGKSYGGGALKVEPRKLDLLEIPDHVLQEVGLEPPRTGAQLTLLDSSHPVGTKPDTRPTRPKGEGKGSAA